MLAAGLYTLYHPLGAWTRTLPGSSPALPLDLALPLWPSWVYPYSWFFFLGFLPFFSVREPRLFRRVVLAYCAVEVVALVCFVVFPVQMIHRPDAMAQTSFATWGLSLALWLDTPANCFPSLHVACSVLAALTTSRADPLLGRVALVMAALIALSTLLVKQHYLVDVVAGAGLAWVMHRLLVVPLDLDDVPLAERAFPRRWSLILLVGWAGSVLGFFAAYLAGWNPTVG